MKRFSACLAVLLLAGTFGFSAWHVVNIPSGEDEKGRTIIRIGHWMQQTGMRESFDDAAREYEKLHPEVRVVQISVPIRAWPTWVRTQLIGGTAPDITGLSGTDEVTLGRYFHSLNDRIDAPNPYNAGTPLDGIPWRNTFVDGLAGMFARTPTTNELAGVYLQLNTLRLFYNKPLLQEITGSTKPPANFAELMALGRQVEAYNRRQPHPVIPIASCEPYAPYLLGTILPSQTQKISRDLSPMRTFDVLPLEMAHLFLTDKLNYERTPEIRSSLSLLRDVSTLVSPGFTSLQRDDALFSFLQRKAVMICAGSWDYAAFVTEGDFDVGISPIPLPDSSDPVYGRFVIGPASEAGGMPEAQFGITRHSRHPEIALDFLHFLTSYPIAKKFSDRTLRLSSIAQVPPPESAPGLAPRLDGEANGFGINPSATFGGGNSYTTFQRNRHLVLGAKGDVDAFAKTLAKEMPDALRQDLLRQMTLTERAVQRLDAHVGLVLTAPPDTATGQTASRLLESQQVRQLDRALYTP